MPRKWILTVKKRPSLADGKAYEATVESVGRSAKPVGLEVTLCLLDKSQAGRKVVVRLLLPVYPDGRPAGLFRAAGLVVEEGQAIDPSEAVGKTVRVRFARRGEDDEGYEAVAFEASSSQTSPRERRGAGSQPDQPAGVSEPDP